MIAQKASLVQTPKLNYDATTLQTGADISAAIRRHTVFQPRVTPQQKLPFIKALQTKPTRS